MECPNYELDKMPTFSDCCMSRRKSEPGAKKVGKKPTLTVWKRIKPDADVLIADIENRLANDRQWQEGFIPNPTTYLNQERWNDAIQSGLPKQLTASDEYDERRKREKALISKINGGDVGVDGETIPPTMDTDVWGDRVRVIPRLGSGT
jgi:hypothetical protein